MKVVILVDNPGTRASEESHLRPKFMIETGGKPILRHIMKHYSEYGSHEFIIRLGYKQYVVKKLFADYFPHTSDVAFSLANNKVEIHNNYSEPWRVTLVNTGLNTMIGGRVKWIERHTNGEPFMLTYGDGVSDVDLQTLLKFHQSHGKTATITTANIGQLEGVLSIEEDNTIHSLRGKEDSDGSLTNDGPMVMGPEILGYSKDDTTVFEKGPMQQLTQAGELTFFRHNRLWQCMGTQREM